ncbi:MAG: sugar transferase [Actinomycetota bacterium]
MSILRDSCRKLLGLKPLRRLLSVLTLAVMDGASLLAGLVSAAYLADGGTAEALYPAPILVTAWIAVFAVLRLYDRAPVRRNPGALLGGALSWAGLAAAGTAVYPGTGLGLAEILFAAIVGGALAAPLRYLFERGVERIYRRGLGQVPVVVMGPADGRARVLRTIASGPGAYSVAGEVETRQGESLAALREALDRTEARGVILVGAERMSDEELLEILRSVRLRGVQMRVVPGALALLRTRAIISHGTGVPLLEVRYPHLDNTQRVLKRAMDVAVSLAGLAVLAPFLLAVAAAVRIDSPGPALFRQKRVGADGKTFICYMFRSMREDAEMRQEGLEASNEAGGPIFKMRDDPRITRVGRLLRRWSIDELPQLWNVLRGEMSLVGPRPLPVRDFLRMEEEHKKRLAAVPGMTGYWQISGRSNLSFEEMVRLDLYYIENWSLSFDLKIILRTIGAVLRREGAY